MRKVPMLKRIRIRTLRDEIRHRRIARTHPLARIPHGGLLAGNLL